MVGIADTFICVVQVRERFDLVVPRRASNTGVVTLPEEIVKLMTT